MLDVLSDIGYRGVASREKLVNKATIIESICYKAIMEPIFPMVQQIKDGLSLFGLLNAIREDNRLFEVLFTPVKSSIFEIKPDDFSDSLEYDYSEMGSNKRELEIKTTKCFMDLIEEMGNDGE